MLQTINSREKPQQQPAVLTIGAISAGAAGNIIPNSGYMLGTIRTFQPEVRELVKRRLTEIAEGVTATLGGTVKVTFDAGTPPLSNDEAMTEEMLGYLRELLGEDQVVPMPPRLASEDFAEVTTRVPGIFLRLSTGSIEEGYCFAGHHPKVRFDEAAMPSGAAAYAYGAFRWLESHADEK